MKESPRLETYKYYLEDLGYLLKEYARDAKKDSAQHHGTSGNDFYIGVLFGYYRVISLMQQQAQSFGIPLEDLRLDDIVPERDLT